MDGAVGDSCQRFIVRHNHESLAVAVAQVEEQLVQLGFVLAVEATTGFVGQDC